MAETQIQEIIYSDRTITLLLEQLANPTLDGPRILEKYIARIVPAYQGAGIQHSHGMSKEKLLEVVKELIDKKMI